MKRRRFTFLFIYLFLWEINILFYSTLLNIISSAAFVIMTFQLRLKLPLTSLTVNSHQGRGDFFSFNARSL